MRTFILIGWTGDLHNGAQPSCLYCGQEGTELQKVAEAARETGKYARLGKLVNPSFVPMPIVLESKLAEANDDGEVRMSKPKRARG